MLMLTHVLQAYDVDPATVRAVRHSDNEIAVHETFNTDREKLRHYTAWQRPNWYGDSDCAIVFCRGESTTALFLIVYAIEGCDTALTEWHRQNLDECELPADWVNDSVYYRLREMDVMADLSERLVIEWGRGTQVYTQRKTDKEVVELRPRPQVRP